MNGLREIINQNHIDQNKAVARRVNASNPGKVGVEKYDHHEQELHAAHFQVAHVEDEIWITPVNQRAVQLAYANIPQGTVRHGLTYKLPLDIGKEVADKLSELAHAEPAAA